MRIGDWDAFEFETVSSVIIYPSSVPHVEAPPGTPVEIAQDYIEAQKVLPISPRASAALGRRCLQAIFHSNGIKKRDLASEIQEFLDSATATTTLHEEVDAIRHIGNFAAHPLQQTQSGSVAPVDKDEAEWTLELLGMFLDHYYAQPARSAKRRQKLNAKLTAMGKPTLKTPKP